MKNKNTELITEFWKALNKREYSVIDKICSSNIIARSYGISRSNVNNINEWKNEIEHLFNSFPDYFLEIHKIVAEGNEVWVFGTQHATQTSEFHGFPSTNNKFAIALFAIYEFQNGLIAKETILTDTLNLYTQLGQAILNSNDEIKIQKYFEHLKSIGILI